MLLEPILVLQLARCRALAADRAAAQVPRDAAAGRYPGRQRALGGFGRDPLTARVIPTTLGRGLRSALLDEDHTFAHSILRRLGARTGFHRRVELGLLFDGLTFRLLGRSLLGCCLLGGSLLRRCLFGGHHLHLGPGRLLGGQPSILLFGCDASGFLLSEP